MQKLIKTILVTSALISTISCEEFLSETPDNRTFINDLNDISELLTNAYPTVSYLEIAETLSDNVGDKSGTPQELNRALYQYQDIDVSLQLDYPNYYWNGCYNSIAHANQALLSIKELGSTVESEPLEGEALLARAYGHFMLVNLWAKTYNPNTAPNDLGIPYIESPETEFTPNYIRNTVKDVYDKIERDLLRGIELVGNKYEEPKFHWTPDAAYAFASRFYLYKGEWKKVIDYSSKLIDKNPLNFRDYINTYNNLDYTNRTALYGSKNESSNLLIVFAESLYGRNFVNANFALSTEMTAQLFNGNNLVGRRWVYSIFGRDGANNLPKFDEFFDVTNVIANIGDPYISIALFSREEVLFNRAEAYAMLNEYDNSRSDLDFFFEIRSINYNSSTDKLTDKIITDAYPARSFK